MRMSGGEFTLPVMYDLTATLLFAATGALLATKKGYDTVGIAIVAIISGAGGGIIRDAIFLNIQPAFITNWRYIVAVLIGGGLVILGRSLFRARLVGTFIMLVDALGIGMYGVFGAQKALSFELSVFAAIIVGVVAATGGGLLRDIVLRDNPKNLLPEQLYGTLAVIGVVMYVTLTTGFNIESHIAAWSTIIAIFIARLIAIKYDIRTRPVVEMTDPSAVLISQVEALPDFMKKSQHRIIDQALHTYPYNHRHDKHPEDDVPEDIPPKPTGE